LVGTSVPGWQDLSVHQRLPSCDNGRDLAGSGFFFLAPLSLVAYACSPVVGASLDRIRRTEYVFTLFELYIPARLWPNRRRPFKAASQKRRGARAPTQDSTLTPIYGDVEKKRRRRRRRKRKGRHTDRVSERSRDA
jgi:hypothetical protein